MLGTCLENVRNTVPLVHNITNYVTVNDVANILLACGGSPIMSDEPEDVEDITSICGGLNINIGTLNQRSIEGMFRAGAKANALGHVVLLDPVGAGASALRTNTAVELMEKIKFTVIRGNISEIKTLALGSGTTKGVDADVADAVTDANLDSAVKFVKDFAAKSGAIVAVAAYAPSWKNSQTTRYTLLTKREEIDRVADECTMGFQKNIDTLHGAPALVVLTTVNDRSGYERDGSFSTSKETHWQSFDAGLAAEAFCVAAHDAGLGTVILGIYDEGKVKAVLNLPETESVSALIPIGVPAESPAAPKRKDVSELLRIR